MAAISSPTGRRAASMPLSATRPKFARHLDIEPLTSSTTDGDELYNHINTRIYSLDVSKKRQPYRTSQPGEKLVATGVLVIQRRKPFGLVILSVGSQVSHTLFKRSKAWEVGQGVFCLRIDNVKYWRIEIRENSGGTLKADELKELLKTVISFETEDCPFRRGLKPEEEEESDTGSTVSTQPSSTNSMPVRKRVQSISLANGSDVPSFFARPKTPQLTASPSLKPQPRPLHPLRQRSVSVAPDFSRTISTESISPPYVTPDESPHNSYLTLPLREREGSSPAFVPRRVRNRTPSPPISRRRGRDGPTPLAQPLSPILQLDRTHSPSNTASSHPTTPTLCHTSDFDFSPTTSDSECDSSIWSPIERTVSITHEKHSSPRAAQILSRTAGLITTTVLRPSATLASFMLAIAGKVARGALEVGTGKFENVHGSGAYPGAWEDGVEEDGYVFQDDFGIDLRGRR